MSIFADVRNGRTHEKDGEMRVVVLKFGERLPETFLQQLKDEIEENGHEYLSVEVTAEHMADLHVHLADLCALHQLEFDPIHPHVWIYGIESKLQNPEGGSIDISAGFRVAAPVREIVRLVFGLECDDQVLPIAYDNDPRASDSTPEDQFRFVVVAMSLGVFSGAMFASTMGGDIGWRIVGDIAEMMR